MEDQFYLKIKMSFTSKSCHGGITSTAGGGSITAPAAAYILANSMNTAGLTDYRVIAAGAGIGILDGGSLGSITISNTNPTPFVDESGASNEVWWDPIGGNDVNNPSTVTHRVLTYATAVLRQIAKAVTPANRGVLNIAPGLISPGATFPLLPNWHYKGSGDQITRISASTMTLDPTMSVPVIALVVLSDMLWLSLINLDFTTSSIITSVIYFNNMSINGSVAIVAFNVGNQGVFKNLRLASTWTQTGFNTSWIGVVSLSSNVTLNSSSLCGTVFKAAGSTLLGGNFIINYTAGQLPMDIDLSSAVVTGDITITGTGVCGAGSVTIKLPLKYANLIISGTSGFVVDNNNNALNGTNTFVNIEGVNNVVTGTSYDVNIFGGANNLSGTNTRVLINGGFALGSGTNESTIVSGGSSGPGQISFTNVISSIITGITHFISDSTDVVVSGYNNVVANAHNSVIGGQQNAATNSSIVGCDGYLNSILNTTSASISGQNNSIVGGSNNRIDGRLNSITTGVQCAIRGYNNVITGGNDCWIEGYGCQFDGGVTNDINILKGYNVRLINTLNHRYNMWMNGNGGAHGRAATTYSGSILIATGVPTAASAFDNSGVVAPPVGYEANNTVAIYGDRIVMDCNNAGEMRCVGVNNLRSANAPTTGDDYCNKTYVDSLVPAITPSRSVWLLCLGNGSIPLTNVPQALWVDASGPGIHDGFYASLDAQINGAVNSGSALSSGPDYTNAGSGVGEVRFNHGTLPGAYIIDVVPPPTGSWEIEYKVNFQAGGALALPELYWSTDAAGLVVISGSAASPRPVTTGTQIEIYNKFIVQLVVGAALYFQAYDASGTPGTISSNRDDGFNWQFTIRQITN